MLMLPQTTSQSCCDYFVVPVSALDPASAWATVATEAVTRQ